MIRMVFTSEGFFEVAIESWSEWDLCMYIYTLTLSAFFINQIYINYKLLKETFF